MFWAALSFFVSLTPGNWFGNPKTGIAKTIPSNPFAKNGNHHAPIQFSSDGSRGIESALAKSDHILIQTAVAKIPIKGPKTEPIFIIAILKAPSSGVFASSSIVAKAFVHKGTAAIPVKGSVDYRTSYLNILTETPGHMNGHWTPLPVSIPAAMNMTPCYWICLRA